MFIAIGLFILSQPIRSALNARSTVYAVSDQRLFILSGGWSKRVESYRPDQIATLERTERAGGHGDIVFRREAQATNSRFNGRSFLKDIGFYGVPEVRQVEAAIQRLAATAKPT
jgi:hypothetical protein